MMPTTEGSDDRVFYMLRQPQEQTVMPADLHYTMNQFSETRVGVYSYNCPFPDRHVSYWNHVPSDTTIRRFLLGEDIPGRVIGFSVYQDGRSEWDGNPYRAQEQTEMPADLHYTMHQFSDTQVVIYAPYCPLRNRRASYWNRVLPHPAIQMFLRGAYAPGRVVGYPDHASLDGEWDASPYDYDHEDPPALIAPATDRTPNTTEEPPPTPDLSHRNFSRQESLVPIDKLRTTPITVVGCGAIGRQVGIMLASIGAGEVTLIDDDVVDNSNITTQGWARQDRGLGKTIRLLAAMKDIDLHMHARTRTRRWARCDRLKGVTFCCVDSIRTRELMFRAFKKDKGQLWIDGRMLGEACQVMPVCDEESAAKYETTLYADDEIERGQCTSKSTIYCANFAAAAMIQQFVRWLRGKKVYAMGGTLCEFLPFEMGDV